MWPIRGGGWPANMRLLVPPAYQDGPRRTAPESRRLHRAGPPPPRSAHASPHRRTVPVGSARGAPDGARRSPTGEGSRPEREAASRRLAHRKLPCESGGRPTGRHGRRGREGGPDSECAVGDDRSAVRHDDLLGDRESQSGSSQRRWALIVGLKEFLEDVRQLRRGNPCSRIAHRQLNLIVERLNAESDAALTLGELEI